MTTTKTAATQGATMTATTTPIVATWTDYRGQRTHGPAFDSRQEARQWARTAIGGNLSSIGLRYEPDPAWVRNEEDQADRERHAESDETLAWRRARLTEQTR